MQDLPLWHVNSLVVVWTLEHVGSVVEVHRLPSYGSWV